MSEAIPLLALSRIAKSYAGTQALRGVELTLRAGEVHAILGENGAGKSTLIKIVTGVVEADAGSEIRIDGVSVTAPTPRHMTALGIAAVYQTPTLFDELSVLENLRIGEDGAIISWRDRRGQASAALARIGATLDLDRPVRELRMAEKQQLEIARVLHRQARVLILDEPTASLGQEDADRLLDLLERLRANGVGILYVSHRLEEVLRIADRATVLRDGAYIGTHERSDLSRSRLVSLMAGRELSETPSKRSANPGVVRLALRGVTHEPSGVRDITLEVRAGEILGLAGLVGSGRTELARVLFGLAPATAGEIAIDGCVVRITSVAEALAHRIAYVPEDRLEHGVMAPLSLVENISLPILRRLSRTWLDEKKEVALAATYCGRLGVKAGSIFDTVGTLSGGNQQKVALARWLATEPRILILDEPTQGVDVGAKAEIHRLIAQLASEGLAIVLISSEFPELLALSDRIAVMRRGQLAGMLDAGHITREAVVHLAMEGGS